MKTKIKSTFGGLVVLAIVMLAMPVAAQVEKDYDMNSDQARQIVRDSQEAAEEAQQEKNGDVSVTRANVLVGAPELISQEGNKLKISFSLSNHELVQPDIKYGIGLFKIMPDGYAAFADEKVYDEFLNLGPQETVDKIVEYQAPQYLSGKFKLGVMAQSSSRLVFGINWLENENGEVKQIELEGSDDGYLEIVSDSCSVTIEGDESETKYTPTQGVDVSEKENLIVHCSVQNHFNKESTFKSRFATYQRSTFGKKVSEQNGDDIVLKSGEKKEISWVLPKITDPQAYDVVLQLQDSQNKIISNKVMVHYVLEGVSATIQNLRMDKNYYSAKETAQLFLDWTGPADNFLGSRYSSNLEKASAHISITGNNGKICAEPLIQALEKSDIKTVKLSVPIKSDCNDPQVAVTIKDQSGKILDERVYSFSSNFGIKKAIADQKASTLEKNKKVSGVVVVVIILLIIIVAILFRKRNPKIINTLLFLLAVLSISLAVGNNSALARWTSDLPGLWSDYIDHSNQITFSYSLNNIETGVGWSPLPGYSGTCKAGTGESMYPFTDELGNQYRYIYKMTDGYYVINRVCQYGVKTTTKPYYPGDQIVASYNFSDHMCGNSGNLDFKVSSYIIDSNGVLASQVKVRTGTCVDPLGSGPSAWYTCSVARNPNFTAPPAPGNYQMVHFLNYAPHSNCGTDFSAEEHCRSTYCSPDRDNKCYLEKAYGFNGIFFQPVDNRVDIFYNGSPVGSTNRKTCNMLNTCDGNISKIWDLQGNTDAYRGCNCKESETSSDGFCSCYEGAFRRSVETSFVVTASPYNCTGTDPLNTIPCTNDGFGLTTNTAKTLVESCSVPDGSSPKCQYVCDANHVYNPVAKVCDPKSSYCGDNKCEGLESPCNCSKDCGECPCVCKPEEDAAQCKGVKYTNSCEKACTGTKNCLWEEIVP